jgi:hypothetical protein
MDNRKLKDLLDRAQAVADEALRGHDYMLKVKALETVLDVCTRVDSELVSSDARKTSNKLIAKVIADLDSPDPAVRAQSERATSSQRRIRS